MREFSIGEEVHVVEYSWMGEEPLFYPMYVDKVNNSSVYLKYNTDEEIPIRFNRKTGARAHSGFGAYIVSSKEDYLKMLADTREKHQLETELCKMIKELSLAELKELKKIITN